MPQERIRLRLSPGDIEQWPEDSIMDLPEGGRIRMWADWEPSAFDRRQAAIARLAELTDEPAQASADRIEGSDRKDLEVALAVAADSWALAGRDGSFAFVVSGEGIALEEVKVRIAPDPERVRAAREAHEVAVENERQAASRIKARRAAFASGDPQLVVDLAAGTHFAGTATELAGLTRRGFVARAGGDGGLGASRIGGLPDLPDEIAWPVNPETGPLAFIAQLNLAALAEHKDWPGPREGLISLFAAIDPEYYAIVENDAAVVLHCAPSATIEPRAFPETLDDLLRMDVSHIARIEPILTLPTYDDIAPSLRYPDLSTPGTQYYEVSEDYGNLRDSFIDAQGGRGGCARLLGWSDFEMHHDEANLTMLLEIAPLPWSGSITFALLTEDLASGRWDRTNATTAFDAD